MSRSQGPTPLVRTQSPLVIGVAGGTGSGKTTVVRAMVDALGDDEVAVLHHDAYYRDYSHLPAEERTAINYDHPDALETPLLIEHLEALCAGRPVDVPRYDFSAHARLPEPARVEPRPVIIVDGILILFVPELRDRMDIKVFVDADPDIRFIRRLERDITERGRRVQSVIRQYVDTVRPMHLEFVEPSKRYADVIVPGGGHNRVAIDMLIAKLHSALQSV